MTEKEAGNNGLFAGELGEVYKECLELLCKREVYVAIEDTEDQVLGKAVSGLPGKASVMGQFHHPNVIRLEGMLTNSRPVMAIPEFVENCALDLLLRGRAAQGHE
ncbi:hypothetical protein CB1_001234007 [Camelus ferus]|nr:hypothetical protein CB1_001234007 [Camelus ferus]